MPCHCGSLTKAFYSKIKYQIFQYPETKALGLRRPSSISELAQSPIEATTLSAKSAGLLTIGLHASHRHHLHVDYVESRRSHESRNCKVEAVRSGRGLASSRPYLSLSPSPQYLGLGFAFANRNSSAHIQQISWCLNVLLHEV